jgi:hypothetical protein
VGIGRHKAAGLGQGLPELEQELAQVGTGTRFRQVGPQPESNLAARLRRIAVEQQVGQQRLESRRADGRQKIAAIGQLEAAQQVEAQGWEHGFRKPRLLVPSLRLALRPGRSHDHRVEPRPLYRNQVVLSTLRPAQQTFKNCSRL